MSAYLPALPSPTGIYSPENESAFRQAVQQALQAIIATSAPESGATADRPTADHTGQFFFDTTLGQPVWWDGVEWVDATGTAA